MKIITEQPKLVKEVREPHPPRENKQEKYLELFERCEQLKYENYELKVLLKQVLRKWASGRHRWFKDGCQEPDYLFYLDALTKAGGES